MEATQPVAYAHSWVGVGRMDRLGGNLGALWGSSGLVKSPGLGGLTPGFWALSLPPCVATDKSIVWNCLELFSPL